VANVAYQSGLADGPPPNDLSGYIEGQMYDPHY
jgi:malate dehydrogenase (oxaloacetate-decarboxylating)(NADP+)